MRVARRLPGFVGSMWRHALVVARAVFFGWVRGNEAVGSEAQGVAV